jgi:hypothetical protein
MQGVSERLMAVLDEARYVRYDADGYVLAWFGGQSTGIHVYDAAGTEVHYWQVEQPPRGDVPFETLRDSMGRFLSRVDEGEDF